MIPPSLTPITRPPWLPLRTFPCYRWAAIIGPTWLPANMNMMHPWILSLNMHATFHTVRFRRLLRFVTLIRDFSFTSSIKFRSQAATSFSNQRSCKKKANSFDFLTFLFVAEFSSKDGECGKFLAQREQRKMEAATRYLTHTSCLQARQPQSCKMRPPTANGMRLAKPPFQLGNPRFASPHAGTHGRLHGCARLSRPLPLC